MTATQVQHLNRGLKRAVKDLTKSALHQLYEAGLNFGLIILPKHYYIPFPDLRVLRRTRAQWARRSGMTGVDVDLDRQVRHLREMIKPFEPEYRGNSAYRHAVAGAFGPGYGYIEAQALHGMIRAVKPRRIIEIGSGVSTYCMLEAIQQNGGEHRTEVLCIEPHPSAWLRQAPVKLVESPMQEVPVDLFGTLEAGDLLFVDSTHTVQLGGDVNRIVLEILPSLKPGTLVHFHDIYLPYDYPRDADRGFFQSMETALLHAFLIGSRTTEILICLSQLHYDRGDALREVFPEYDPQEDVDGLTTGRIDTIKHFPSSIYLRTIAA